MGLSNIKNTVLSKNNVLFLFVAAAFLILISTGCTRNVSGTSVLKISIPTNLGANKITEFDYSEPMSMASVSAQSEEDEGTNWNSSLNPTAIGDVNCYMIAIAGPEADMQRNTCVTTAGTNLKVGRWVGGIPAGGVLSLEVPSGSKREITVIGFRAGAGSCKDFKNSEINGQTMSNPHILGKVTKDLTSGTVAVTVPVTVNASTLKIQDCSGPDFNMDNAPLYFGDMITGTASISTSDTYEGLGGKSYQIIDFDAHPVAPHEGQIFIKTSGTVTLNIGDELMVNVVGMQGGFVGTANTAVSPCGYRAWEGRYGFVRVVGISSSPPGMYISPGSFIDKLDTDPTNYYAGNLHATLVANMSALAQTDTTFCRMRVAKVLQYYNLTLNDGVSLTPSQFVFDGAATGILPIRVANNLTLNDGASINASGLGFTPRVGKHGDGFAGKTAATCASVPTDTRNGGTCSNGALGAGGGGYGNPNGDPFAGSGGTGGGDTWMLGGSGMGDNCGDGSCFGNLGYKIFPGGAGGSNVTNLGGPGGGIVYLMAKTIIVNGNAYIKSNGTAGTTSVTASYGGGGAGAGGSVLLGYKDLQLPGGANLFVQAKGGIGGGANANNAHGAGGGGGGRVQIVSCSNSTAPIATVLTEYDGGYGGSVITGGFTIGNTGRDGSFVNSMVTCN